MKKFCGTDARGLCCFPWQEVSSGLPSVKTFETKTINLRFSVNSLEEIAEIRRNAADVVYGLLRIEYKGILLEEWKFRRATFLPSYEIHGLGRSRPELLMTLTANEVDWVPYSKRCDKVILFEDQ